jgi:hypothetical protein
VPVTELVPATARWTAADGTPRTGIIKTKGGASAGDQVTLWIDQAGAVTDPPTSTAAAAALTVFAAGGIWLAWGAVLFLSWCGLPSRLDHRRTADWDQQWGQIEPLWTGR